MKIININNSNKLSANQLHGNKINEFKTKLISVPSSTGIMEKKLKSRIINNEDISCTNDTNLNSIIHKSISKNKQNEGLQKTNKMNDSLSRKPNNSIKLNRGNEIFIYDSNNPKNKKFTNRHFAPMFYITFASVIFQLIFSKTLIQLRTDLTL